MTYKTWMQLVNEAIKKPLDLLGLTAADYTAIDFRALYRAGFTPSQAGRFAKLINTYLKEQYQAKP